MRKNNQIVIRRDRDRVHVLPTIAIKAYHHRVYAAATLRIQPMFWGKLPGQPNASVRVCAGGINSVIET